MNKLNNYSKFLNSIPFPIAVKDNNYIYRYCNQAFSDLLGITPKNLLGKTDYDLFKQEVELYINSENYVIENGESINERWNIKVVDDYFGVKVLKNNANKLIGLICFNNDETDLLAKIDKLNLDINKHKQINNNNNKLLKIIAHDLRVPLSSVIGFAELLMTEEYGDIENLRFSRFILDSANTALSLLDNLLMRSKLSAGKYNIRKEEVDVSEIISDSISIYKYQAKQKKITIQNKSKNNLYFSLDTVLTTVILRNLISNAIKFSDYNGMIKIDATLEANILSIWVEDNGRGIPEENLSKILNRNEEFTTTGTDRESGYGLGINACQEFAELQGGKFSITSTIPQGTTVKITLPA